MTSPSRCKPVNVQFLRPKDKRHGINSPMRHAGGPSKMACSVAVMSSTGVTLDILQETASAPFQVQLHA